MPSPLVEPRPTALLAEDEPLLAQALHHALRQAWPALNIVAVAGDGKQAVEQALALRPQVLFLDIRMPGQSGLEAAAELVEHWPLEAAPPPLLVFVTAYQQYAIQAFEVQAVDYLLKPLEPQRLARTVERLQHQLQQRSTAPSASSEWESALAPLRQLLAQQGAIESTGAAAPSAQASAPVAAYRTVLQAMQGQQLRFVPVSDVLFLEAADKYVRVVTPTGEYWLRTPLKDLLPQLDPENFWRIHRATVIQAQAVDHARRDALGRWQVLLRGHAQPLAVSRLYAHYFKAL